MWCSHLLPSQASLVQSLVGSLCLSPGYTHTRCSLVPSECLWKARGFVPNVIFALLLSCWGFSFNLRRRVSFFGGIHHSSVGGCSAVNCNFGVLAGADKHTPFTLPS